MGMANARPNYAEQNECNRLLAECKPFARMFPEVRAGIALLMKRRTFAPGEVLMQQGDPGDSLMVVSKGDAEVLLEIPGQPDTLLHTVRRPEVVGEMALITRGQRTATVRARTEVDTFVLPAEAFEQLAQRHSEVTVVMTDLLSDRLGSTRIDAFDHKVVENYRIEGCLARGAMAIVYEAVEVGTEVRFALKMMDHRLSYNSDALTRFHREASIAAQLDHQNLVKVYGKFECYRTFFLVMELCDGPSMAQLLEAVGPLPETAVRSILGQLYCGLTYLHESGTTHRDVKLSNVLSRQDGRIKLADFGLARPKFEPHLTDAGVVLGTPAYMAPEQFEGKEIDERIDFYALGCLAMELLTGKPLFDEDSLPAMISRKMTFTLPARRRIREDLSEELYDLIGTALQHDPNDRVLPRDVLLRWAQPLDRSLLVNDAWNAYNISHGSTERMVQEDDGEMRPS
jgi:CRP-like cAMP-binding protein